MKKKYTLKLKKTINELKRLQQGYSTGNKVKDKDYDYEEDEEYKKLHLSSGNSLGAVMKRLKGLFKTINILGNFVIAILFLYFGSIILRKFCDKKNKNKDKIKSKDKQKKK